MVSSVSDDFNPILKTPDYESVKPSYFEHIEETELFPRQKSLLEPTIFTKGEFSYNPETGCHSFYGGGGLSYKFGKTSIDGFFGGKTSDDDNHGYMAETVIDQKYPDFMQPFDNLTFSSNVRIRYNNCGCENIQYRLTPLKVSYNIDNDLVPVDSIYAYPAYVTVFDDLKGDNDAIKFGSLIGVQKKIAGQNYYVELQVDTNNERSSEVNACLNFGFKF